MNTYDGVGSSGVRNGYKLNTIKTVDIVIYKMYTRCCMALMGSINAASLSGMRAI